MDNQQLNLEQRKAQRPFYLEVGENRSGARPNRMMIWSIFYRNINFKEIKND